MGLSPGVNFFSVNYWFLSIAGLMSPNNGGRTSKLIFFVRSRIVMSLVLYYVVAEWLGIMDTYQDKYDLSKCVNAALSHTVGLTKELFVLRNNQKFKRIMAKVDGGEFSYEKCQEKGFDPESIIESYKQFGRFCTYLFLCLGLLTATSGIVPQLVGVLVLMRNRNGTDGNFTMPKLPYSMWTPIEITTLCEFSLAVFYQSVPFYYHCFGIIGVDTLCVNIMNCVAMNLTLIQNAYSTMRERCIKKVPDSYGFTDSPELSRELKLEMKKICRHLQSIYKVCGDLEDLNKYVFLIQTGGSLFGICASLYVTLNTPLGDKKMIHECCYLMILNVQLVLFCWFGNEVKIKAENISFCIWESDWIGMDTSLKKDMILTMARTNVPLVFTTGNFFPLTLETFMKVLKGSYSFYAFMRSSQ